jgi:hypothetical protein
MDAAFSISSGYHHAAVCSWSIVEKIRAGVCFAMIGDESEDILQSSDRISTVLKQSSSL